MNRPTFRDVRDHYACENCGGVGVFRSTEMMSGQDRETGAPFYIAHEDPCPACNGSGIELDQEDEELRYLTETGAAS